MATASIPSLSLHTLRAVVPRKRIRLADEADQFPGGAAQVARLERSLGLAERRVAADGQTALDLGDAAARATLLAAGGAAPDTLIFVTQTPDHLQPGNASILHGRLELPVSCAAFDVNQGCAGFVYGLWLANSLLAAGGAQRVLLVCADTLSRVIHPEDGALRPLFGDAAAAALLERDDSAPPTAYALHSDGSGASALCQPASGLRSWPGPANAEPQADAEGHRRSPQNLVMDGAAVFNFSVRRAPEVGNSLLQQCGKTADDVGTLWLHQANRFIVQGVAKRLGVPLDRVPVESVRRFGNTSSASIPLAWALQPEAPGPFLAIGFGVGLAWAGVWLERGWQKPPELIDLAADQSLAGEDGSLF